MLPTSGMSVARTAGRSWLVLGGLGALAVAQACTKDPVDTGQSALISALLADVGVQVVQPNLVAFDAQLDVLDVALASWQTSGDRSEAQEAWKAAMLLWEELEVQQLGPARSSVTSDEGEDIRDEIYSWPTVNGCRVDQETLEEAWDDADFFETELVNSYGLDALEHVLFADDETVCPSQVGIDADWESLGAEGVQAHRVAYAQAMTAELHDQVEGLDGAWVDGYEPADLDAVFEALFYLELETKDAKLAKPLGLMDCSETTCEDSVECIPSGLGVDAIQANLVGFRELFGGGEGTGFDDLLADVGHGDLSDEILARTDDAISVAEGIEGRMDELVVSRPEDVEALHAAVKEVTDLLKGDLATVLILSVPEEGSGDND